MKKETFRNHQRKISIQYFCIIGCFSLLFFTSFHVSILNGFTILFYRGMVGLLISLLLTVLLVFILLKQRILFTIADTERIILLLVATVCIHLSLFIVLPVTYERSISMFLLRALEKKGTMTKQDMNDTLIYTYIMNKDAVGKRISEQLYSSFIKKDKNETISLTRKGRMFLYISNTIQALYGVQ